MPFVPGPDPVPGRTLALQSTLWAIGGALGRYLLAGITTLILTHFLSPDEFGLVALTIAAQIVIEYIAPAGFHDALIQRPHLTDSDLNAAFWSITASAVGAALLVVALAPTLAGWFDQPRLTVLLITVAGVSLLRAVSTVPRALLNRSMDFRTLALIRLRSMLVASLGAIALAALGGGMWSLIARLALFNAVGAWLFYRRVPWRPDRSFTRPSLKALWSFAPSVAIFAALSYFIGQADDQLIGLRLGTTALGYYALAYSFVAWPVQDVLGGLAGVLYPVFSRLQDDLPRLQTVYLESLQIAALIAFPTLALLAITAPQLVPWLLGARWEPIVLAVQILAIGGIRESTAMFNGQIYRALGRPGLHALFELCGAACYLTAFVVGLNFGIEGVALFYVLTGLVLQPVSWWLVLGLAHISLGRWLGAIAPAAAAAGVMAVGARVALWAARAPLGLGPEPSLFGTALVAALIYGVAVWWTSRDLAVRYLSLALRLLGVRQPAP